MKWPICIYVVLKYKLWLFLYYNILQEIESLPQQALDVKKIFVGGIKHLEEADLQEHFMQFGNIVSCDIIINRDTGIKRGFAFIEFDDTDAVDKVICKCFCVAVL